MTVAPKRILWPTDFSPLALHGARYARGLQQLFGSELHVVHILMPPLAPDVSVTVPADPPLGVVEDELLAAAHTRLTELVAAQFPGLPVVTKVILGTSWTTICGYAERTAIDLIVVATHGRTGLRHVLIGSTAERIVQHAPCPVLVVKSPAKDFVTD
jgi:universal stress protein A